MRSENALERSDGLRIGPTSGRRRATVAEPTSNIANRAVISQETAPQFLRNFLAFGQIFLGWLLGPGCEVTDCTPSAPRLSRETLE